jgi:hypothetical protein
MVGIGTLNKAPVQLSLIVHIISAKMLYIHLYTHSHSYSASGHRFHTLDSEGRSGWHCEKSSKAVNQAVQENATLTHPRPVTNISCRCRSPMTDCSHSVYGLIPSKDGSFTLPPASPSPATGRLYDQPANCCCMVCDNIGPST